MTGYRNEDSTYKDYDLETIQGSNTWRVYIYKNGIRLCVLEHTKRKVVYATAKGLIDEWTANGNPLL